MTRTIRPARPDEAELLTELTCRPKTYWDYSVPFIAAFRASLTPTPGQIAVWPT